MITNSLNFIFQMWPKRCDGSPKKCAEIEADFQKVSLNFHVADAAKFGVYTAYNITSGF